MRATIAAEFERVGNAAAAAYETGSVQVQLAELIQTHQGKLMGAIRPRMLAIARALGDHTLDQMGKKSGPQERRDVLSNFDEIVQPWTERVTANKVVQISETTRRQIKDAIADALANGAPAAEVAKIIREKTGDVIGKLRAATIARTEIHSAANHATDAMQQAAADDRYAGEWIATNDARTRETHVEADGQIRPVGEPFDVGGAKMLYPGDPQGPAEEVINCRCVKGTVFLPDKRPTEATPAPVDDVPPVDAPASLDLSRQSAAAYVVEMAAGTHVEHGAIIDLSTGTTVRRVVGRHENRLSLSADDRKFLNTPGKKYEVWHNHPSDGSLSLDDLVFARGYRGVSAVVAQGHAGSFYRIADAGDPAKWQSYRRRLQVLGVRLDEKLISELRRGEWTEAEQRFFAGHVFNLLVHRMGWAEYTYRLGDKWTALMAQHGPMIDRVLDALAKELGK